MERGASGAAVAFGAVVIGDGIALPLASATGVSGTEWATGVSGGRDVSRPMKNATDAISATRTTPAAAINHFGMCISQALAGSAIVASSPRRKQRD